MKKIEELKINIKKRDKAEKGPLKIHCKKKDADGNTVEKEYIVKDVAKSIIKAPVDGVRFAAKYTLFTILNH